MYTPKYMDILKKRTDIPRVIRVGNENRLVILPGEDKESTTNIGRPIGEEYWNVEAKLKFMTNHGIETSVISLANPWLDFLTGKEAASVAQELNDELQSICESSKGHLFGFATLPVRNPAASVAEVRRLKSMSCIKGVILGTPGAGNGLDHDNMRDVLEAISDAGFMVFMHPHYGVGTEHFHDSGHALFLALGFPFETTVAVSRLIVSGTLDRIPHLKLLVAHAGAALPALIGRLDSCVAHDIGKFSIIFFSFLFFIDLFLAIANRLQHEPSAYLRNMYFDAISYGAPALQSLIAQVGEDRIMFGTDNPFFPPVGASDVTTAMWPSAVKVLTTIDELNSPALTQKILFGNAKTALNL
jgi:predicted TIM-barrel fold metal-dependent hydrolase